MHKLLFNILAGCWIITLSLVACQPAMPKEIDCTRPEVLCVGLVTGLEGVNDKSFNQSTWEGLLSAQAEKIVARAYYIETVDFKDYETNLDTLVGSGYDIIVTVGDAFNEVTTNAAKNNPDTLFIGVDQRQTGALPNLAGLVFHDDQSGFLAGAFAALVTKTGAISVVLGTDGEKTGPAFQQGFEAGAKYINPNLKIISSAYSGESKNANSDPQWAVGTSAQAITGGADVVFGVGDKTSKGSLIETARHEGVYCIGFDVDQWELTPQAHSCLVTSVIKQISPSIVDLINLAKVGKFPPGNYYGAYGLAPYHDFENAIPQAVKDKMGQIVTSLKDGSLTTGYHSEP